MKCPIATQDIEVNLENRDHAFEEYGYGPANPGEDDEEFWAKRAVEWNTSPDNAKTMRCGNCAAFIQTPEMMGCIIGGIQKEESDDETYAPEVVEAANLGYCELFEFKCAADRTCSAWLTGGPITKMTEKRKQMLQMAKYEARKGEYENESGEEDLEGDD
jgi:hypothetical protein